MLTRKSNSVGCIQQYVIQKCFYKYNKLHVDILCLFFTIENKIKKYNIYSVKNLWSVNFIKNPFNECQEFHLSIQTAVYNCIVVHS